MARTDYGAILSTVIKDTSDSIREVNGTSALIAPNEWGGLIRAMHSDSDYQNVLSAIPIKTIENVPIASFSDGYNALPFPTLKTTIEAVQSGSGDPSPSNPRPISGWTEANLSRVGKNLLNPTLLKEQAAWNSFQMKLKPNTYYTVSATFTSDSGLILFMNKQPSYGATVSVYNGHPVTILTDSTGIMYFQQRRSSGSEVYSDYEIQVEEGNSVTTFSPYNGNTYTLQFGTTIYGGIIDWVSGVVTVKKALFDLGSVNYTFNSTHGFFYTNMPADSADNIIGGRDGMSDIYKLYQGNLAGFKLTDSTFTYNNSSIGGAKTIGIRDTYTTDVDVFKTRVTGHYVIYELATPTTIQLTPQQIEQLRGENNVFVDCGEVEELQYYSNANVEPQYDITQICDNSSYSSTLTLTDSYSNYDFLKIVIYNSNDSKEYTIFTIPSVLDQIATYGNNLVNFNTVMETNIYCAYTMTSSSTWTRDGNRNSNIKAIYGYKATNKTVSVTPIYARQNINTSSVTPTSTTSLYDYDIIFLATCSGAVDETQPCNNVIYPKGKFNGIPHYFILNKYLGATCVAMTEFTLGANSNYFGVYGIKFE